MSAPEHGQDRTLFWARRTLIALFLIALMAAVGIVLAPSKADAHTLAVTVHPSRAGWCMALQVPVGGGQEVGATLCQPFRPDRGRPVDVLTAGSTYTRSYWDWSSPSYSYVGQALGAGRATLSYDRIGNGTSTRPAASMAITMATDAAVLHRLIGYLHLVGFRHVTSVGHSYGSGVVLTEATTYADVTAVVLTGYLHRPSNPLVTAGNYPANQDPKFADLGLDSGWLTTRPGARAYGFHAVDSDPALIAQDEAAKDLVSLTGLLNFLSDRNVPAAGNISRSLVIPALVVVGQRDAIWCLDPGAFVCDDATVLANEVPYYPNAALTVMTAPGSGHDLTLHPTSSTTNTLIGAWIETASG